MRMMARAIATLRNLVGWAENKLHDRYCPCGCGFPEDGDTQATRIVVPEPFPEGYDRNREATPHVCETSRCWQDCRDARP
jgi:hypothetical protein